MDITPRLGVLMILLSLGGCVSDLPPPVADPIDAAAGDGPTRERDTGRRFDGLAPPDGLVLPADAAPRPDRGPAPPPDSGVPDANLPPCVPATYRPCQGNTTGLCRPGQRRCGENMHYGPCMDVVAPTAEICDGEDNDCDGAIDEEVGYRIDRLARDASPAVPPVLTHTGGGWVIAWAIAGGDGTWRVQMGLVSGEGQLLREPLEIARVDGAVAELALAAGPDRAAVAWHEPDAGRVCAAEVDLGGAAQPVGWCSTDDEVAGLLDNDSQPEILWLGTAFSLLWVRDGPAPGDQVLLSAAIGRPRTLQPIREGGDIFGPSGRCAEHCLVGWLADGGTPTLELQGWTRGDDGELTSNELASVEVAADARAPRVDLSDRWGSLAALSEGEILVATGPPTEPDRFLRTRLSPADRVVGRPDNAIYGDDVLVTWLDGRAEANVMLARNRRDPGSGSWLPAASQRLARGVTGEAAPRIAATTDRVAVVWIDAADGGVYLAQGTFDCLF